MSNVTDFRPTISPNLYGMLMHENEVRLKNGENKAKEVVNNILPERLKGKWKQ